jgi:hypothetical protein
MISRFAFVIVAAGSICFTTLPAAAEDVGVGPVGVTIGDHDRDRDRDHDKTIIIKKDHDGDREKTVIKKDRDD